MGQPHTCPVCNGTKKKDGKDCPTCEATGVVVGPEESAEVGYDPREINGL